MRTTELTVGAGEVRLAGTLVEPEAGAGPAPLVLFIGGSGPLDRDKTLWASWCFENAGIKVYFGGDGGFDEEGFREIGLVDVFDAGPTVACHRDAIRTVKDSRALPVSIEKEPEGGKALVAVNRVENFRATRAVVEVAAEHAYITAETAEGLKVKDGDLVRVMA